MKISGNLNKNLGQVKTWSFLFKKGQLCHSMVNYKLQERVNMGLFEKSIGPVFLKESTSLTDTLNELQQLKDQVIDEQKEELERDMQFIQYGIKGEENIAFELKNSHYDMYILHDLFLEHDGLTAQIDYMIITKYTTYILEAKNLYGNITIDNKGNFIRSTNFHNHTFKEGIYSPITQNQRHLELIKELRLSEKNNFITKKLYTNNFYKNCKSLVVLTNPKTILNDRYAPKDIKSQVIRADALMRYIKNIDQTRKDCKQSIKYMESLAQYFLSCHKENPIHYADKYQIKQTKPAPTINIQEELRSYRYNQAQAEGLKPYMVFNNAEMEALIQAAPQSKEELLKVKGFGPVKVEKYGDALIQILSQKTA